MLAALDEKRPGSVLMRDIERVLERSGEAPVYGPNYEIQLYIINAMYLNDKKYTPNILKNILLTLIT